MHRDENGGKRWPESMYDYERGVVVDGDVAAVDLDCGEWVRCLWCEKELRMNSTFRLFKWASHKKTIGHRDARKRTREPPVGESPTSTHKSISKPPNARKRVRKQGRKESPALNHKSTARCGNAEEQASESRFAESPEYDDFASAMVESIEENNCNLTFHRQELAKRAKSEVNTKKLIREMALLVTEQQEDVEALRDEVDELKELVYELHDTIENMRRGLWGSQQKKRRLHYDVAHSPMQQVTLPRTNRDVGLTEIDMFDNEVQLVQSN